MVTNLPLINGLHKLGCFTETLNWEDLSHLFLSSSTPTTTTLWALKLSSLVYANYVYILQISEDTKQRRETASKNLRKALEAGTAKPERRIYVELPLLSDHEHHFEGEVSCSINTRYRKSTQSAGKRLRASCQCKAQFAMRVREALVLRRGYLRVIRVFIQTNSIVTQIGTYF